MANAATTASDEREGSSVMLLVLAVARRIEAKTTGDQRFVAAANSVKQIERTLHRVDDVTLLKLASINAAADGLLSTLIAARPKTECLGGEEEALKVVAAREMARQLKCYSSLRQKFGGAEKTSAATGAATAGLRSGTSTKVRHPYYAPRY
jgi:hypothetical protein